MIYQEVLDRTDHISIKDMEHEVWLDTRRSFIGGSDAGAVTGYSDYKTPYMVFQEKKGKAKTEENAAMLRGSIMEPYIRQLTQKRFPSLIIEEAPFIFLNKTFPFMGANVDGFIFVDDKAWENDHEYRLLVKNNTLFRGLGVHEIKTSQDGYGFGVDEIPNEYYSQVQHYLVTNDLKWAILTVYIISKNELRHYPILRDEEFISGMVSKEKDFWENNILKNIEPSLVGIQCEEDFITSQFSGSETLLLNDTQRDLCGEYVLLNQQIKELEAKKQAVKVNLMQGIVKKAQGNPAERKVFALAGPYSVSWTTVERKDVDRDALRKAGLFEQYQKVSTYDRFMITEKKGA